MPRCTDTAWLAGLHTHYTHSSLGSFFAFEPLTGSYEVNPPFVETMYVAVAEHCERLLAAAEDRGGYVGDQEALQTRVRQLPCTSLSRSLSLHPLGSIDGPGLGCAQTRGV